MYKFIIAVATAAATTMASRAEAARPRRSTAARQSMRRNIEVWAAFARRSTTFSGAFSDLARGLLMHLLAGQIRDRTARRAGWQRHCPQTSRSLRWTGSQERAQAES